MSNGHRTAPGTRRMKGRAEDRRGRFTLRGRSIAGTLVYVTTGRAVRLDFDRHGRPVGTPVNIEATSSGEDAATHLVELALSEGRRRPGRTVRVLCDTIAMHVLTLPSAQVHGLEDTSLEGALAYEFEAITGTGVRDRKLAVVDMGRSEGIAHFWLACADRGWWEKLGHAVRRAGGRLAGVAHPGGIPRSVSEAAEEPWARVETWPECVIARASGDTQTLPMQIWPADMGPTRIQRELERWILGLHGRYSLESVTAGPSWDLAALPTTRLQLEEQDDLVRLLSMWWATLAGGQPRVPVLRPEARGGRELKIASGLAAAALLACAGHFGWTDWRYADLSARLGQLRVVEQELKRVRAEVAIARSKRDDLREAASTLAEGTGTRVSGAMGTLRHRLPRLLRALAQESGDHLVVTGLHSAQDAVRISGAALTATAAGDLSERLEIALAGNGWAPAPMRQRAMRLLPGDGPWEFELVLQETDLDPAIDTQSAEALAAGIR